MLTGLSRELWSRQMTAVERWRRERDVDVDVRVLVERRATDAQTLELQGGKNGWLVASHIT